MYIIKKFDSRNTSFFHSSYERLNEAQKQAKVLSITHYPKAIITSGDFFEEYENGELTSFSVFAPGTD